MSEYENELLDDVRRVRELSTMDYKHYMRAKAWTIENIRDYIVARAKNLKALQYWLVNGDRILTLFDGEHNKQINIILGR